ncbi:DMT family transporter [Pelagibius marinus]|uniref:DMT family transporter n=1 Tax=Pelagibius marinus TaxID=2762760 RepID=UPI0018725517|nr:DMT family transporter [Pelagibius marinus]
MTSRRRFSGAAAAARVTGAWLRLSPNHRGALWMIAASLGFTINSAMVKTLVGEGLDVFQIAFARALFSFALVLPFLLRAGPSALRTRHPGLHGIRAFAGAAAMVCGFYAVGQLPLADFTALSFTQPLFVTLLAVLILGEVVRWRRWLATAVGFIGVLIMVRPGAATFDPAALVALASVLGIAVAVTMVKRLPEGESHATMLAYFCLMSLAITVLPALIYWTPPTLEQWGLLAAVGSLGVGSQAMIIRAYRAGEASFVAPFDYLKLILAGLIGFFFFSELPGPWTLVGAAVIVGAAFYIAHREAALTGVRTAARRKPLPPPAT